MRERCRKTLANGRRRLRSGWCCADRDERIVELTNGASIPTHTLVWTAGTAAHLLIANLPLTSQNGRVKVDEGLEPEGWSGVWAVGDCAAIADSRTGGVTPRLRSTRFAKVEAVARNIIATLRRRPRRAFNFTVRGKLAAVGR